MKGTQNGSGERSDTADEPDQQDDRTGTDDAGQEPAPEADDSLDVPRVDPPAQRKTVRVTNVYATSGRVSQVPHADPGEVADYLRFGRLERYYRLSDGQLPRVLARRELDVATLEGRRWRQPERLVHAWLWLFTSPSDQVLVALTLDVDCAPVELIPLLEDCYYTDAEIARAVWDGLARLGFHGGHVLEPGCGAGNFIGLAPDSAQMVGVEVDPTTSTTTRAGTPSTITSSSRVCT